MTARLGVDIGGTFTDFIAVDDRTGEFRIHKRPSTPSDPADAFALGLAEADFAEVGAVIHGTTVGTNMVIERRGARIGLITTRGFRDVLEIARGNRPSGDHFNLRWDKPEPIVPRTLRRELTERITYDGRVLQPLDQDECLHELDYLLRAGCTAVAVCLLFSHANPAHEQLVAEIAREHLPELAISLSSSLVPQWREYERTSTTVADAYIKPQMGTYLRRIEDHVRTTRDANVLVMKSNGGLMTARTAAAEPVHTLLSGPAAGALAGKFIGASAGVADVLTMDMGGTSFDLSLVRNGGLAESTENHISRGVLIQLPMVDIRTIGAGGGSIAWLDGGGALKVGPRSAGAEPGPACYRRGGNEATVTDANVLLGRIGSDALLGGALELDPEASARVLQRLADSAGLETVALADGIVTICVSNMVHEVRAISAQQGLDPRSFALVAAGGAGPLHAALIAGALGIDTIVVPPHPGLLSATGLLLAELKFDLVRSWPFVLERITLGELVEALREMGEQARSLIRAEGYAGDVTVVQSLEMRYRGQNWEITVPLLTPPDSIDSVGLLFDDEHERLYGVRVEGAQHEIVNLRVTGIGPHEAPERWLPSTQFSDDRDKLRRRRVFDRERGGFVEANVHTRSVLRSGYAIDGPCIIEQVDSTTYVPSSWSGRVDTRGNLLLEHAAKAHRRVSVDITDTSVRTPEVRST
jgi:N-methylhydantoinase A